MMTARGNLYRGHMAALFTIIVWGTTFISIKYLLGSFNPAEILFYRLVLAYVALFLASPKLLKVASLREELLFAGAGLCGVTLYFNFQNSALTLTQASNVGVLTSVAPFFTALLSRYLLKDERLHIHFFIGFVVAMLGIGLISFNGSVILKLNPLGDLLSVLAALAWAFYSIILKKMGDLRYRLISMTRKIFFYGLVFTLPVLLVEGLNRDVARFASLPVVLNYLFLGVGASALCFVTWNLAVGILGPVKTSVYIYAIPVVTIATSALLLGERVTPVAALGVALILSGLYLSERRPIKNDVEQATD